MDDQDRTEIVHDGRVTRRRMLLGTAGAIGAAALLAACGDDDDSGGAATPTTSGGGTATTTGGGSETTAAGGSATTSGGGGGGETDLAKLLGIEEASAGKGQTIELGAVLALTGTGSFYGKTMSRGLDLAAKHIQELGGPTFKYTYLDHKSGDAPAGVQAMAELVSKKIQAKFASYVDDLGAMLGATAENKMFTLDGGGGTSIFGQGQPYFWGTRAITPERPDARAVQVAARAVPGFQDHRVRGLGHRRAEQQHDQGRHPQARSRTAGTSSTTSTSSSRWVARTSPRCCRR